MAELWWMTSLRHSCRAELWFTDVPLRVLMRNPAPSPMASLLCFLVFSKCATNVGRLQIFPAAFSTPTSPSLYGSVTACLELFTVNRKSLQARSHSGLVSAPQQKHTVMPHKRDKTTMMAALFILLITPSLLQINQSKVDFLWSLQLNSKTFLLLIISPYSFLSLSCINGRVFRRGNFLCLQSSWGRLLHV